MMFLPAAQTPSHSATVTPAAMTSPVELRPFPHQVAGQSLILRYDVSTICKSVMPRERQFYLTLHESLRPFVPQYKGIIYLHLPSDPEHPMEGDVPKVDWLSSTNGKDLSYISANHSLDSSLIAPNQVRGLRKSCSSGMMNGQKLYEFLLLEDLISKFEKPSVLDLKMGTRQHGDDAPADKVAYQVNKCRSTTSGSMGIRLCGMKKFNSDTGEYEKRDKVQGRQLRDDDIKAEITNFLSSGGKIRRDVTLAILRRLKRLRSVIEKLDGYRFYSCSLLVVYEGNVRHEISDKSLDTLGLESNGFIESMSHLENEHSSDQFPSHDVNGSLENEKCTSLCSRHMSDKNDSNNSLDPENTHADKLFRDLSHLTCFSDKCCVSHLEHSSSTSQLRTCSMQKVLSPALSNQSQEPSEQKKVHPLHNVNPELCRAGISSAGNFSQGVVNECELTSHPLIKTCSSEKALDFGKGLNSQSSRPKWTLEPEDDDLLTDDSEPATTNLYTESTSRLPKDGVEVRVVDFAHATFPGFDFSGSKQHAGPDRGFLVGIESLMTILTEFLLSTEAV